MAARPAVILSPHLDDAVLSCWHLLSGPGDVTVINVFAGSPTPGSGTYWWDRATGSNDSVVRMQERRAEDREALAIAGRSATDLEFLDEQYEPTGQTVEGIAAGVRELIDPESVVYAPAALGKNDDHERVRSAALLLAASGQSVCLYADHPHAVQFGWPHWVDGAQPGPGVGEHWNQRLIDAGIAPPDPEVHHLDATERERKLRSASTYGTQIPGLESAFGVIDGFPALPHEIIWRLA